MKSIILITAAFIVFVGAIASLPKNEVCASATPPPECLQATATPEATRSPEPSPTPSLAPEPTSTPFQHQACGRSCGGDQDCRNLDPSYICNTEHKCRLLSAPEREDCTERPESTEEPKSVILPDLGVQPLGVQK